VPFFGFKGAFVIAISKAKDFLTPDQLAEGQRLADEWKENVQWPPEIAERAGPPN